ncbi:MAG: DnaJ domain-containing protein [Deltaproteobacteria bacterium]|nr:DnaJ domain-containing protein [Deltaproteobacteria bacterium]
MAITYCYHILGVSPSASFEEIRRQYRHLALRYHHLLLSHLRCITQRQL